MGAKPAKRPFNARRWQMAATHVKEQQQPYIPARTACSRIRKKVRLAFFLPAYYSAAVARRYLKSGMSNTDVARRRRQEDVSRESNRRDFIVIRGDAKTSSSYLQFVPLDSLLSALFRFDSRSQRGRFRSVTVSRG